MKLRYKESSEILTVLAYFLINFTMLCGGNTRALGPFSLRHLCMFVLLGVAIFYHKKVRITKGGINLYLIYLLVYTICNLINGEVTSHSFAQSLYTYHGPCLALAFSLPALVKDVKHVKMFVWSLIGLYLINSIVSIFQFMNNGTSWEIANMISNQAEEGMEKAEMYINAEDSLIGYSIIAGLFGFVVTNGYFLSSYLPVFAYRINKKGTSSIVISLLCLAIGGVTIYLSQQRMAFLAFILFLGYFMWFGVKKNYRLYVVLGVVAVLSFYGLNNIEMGRLNLEHDDGSRMRIFGYFMDFLGSEQVLFGGYDQYMESYGEPQHNSFLSAWVFGGFFTFVTFLFLFSKLLFINLKTVYLCTKKRYHYPYTLCFAVASILFLFYSMTHSAGVQSGSPMYWTAYTMMCISLSIEHKRQQLLTL